MIEVSNEHIGWLLTHSGVIAIFVILFAVIIASIFYGQENQRWKRIWTWIEKHLYIGFVVCWILGFSVYETGMFIKADSGDVFAIDSWVHLLLVSPMAVLHAFGMFLLESDISAVHEEFHNNILYMAFFSIAHFLAVLVSMLFVIKHFGYNIIAGLRLWFTSYFGANKKQLFIFWGTNEASLQLAKDIRNRTLVAENSRSIIVRTDDDSDNTSSRTALERFFNFLSTKNIELEKFKELNCFTTNAFHRLSKLSFTSEERQRPFVPVFSDMLNLSSLTRLIKKTESHIHIFILGENEHDNIKATDNVIRDQELITFAGNVTVYCHARYDGINRVAEDVPTQGNIEVRIVDSSHDSIGLLKENNKWHPVNCVKIDTERNIGTTSSLFCSLVVGFGQTGRDAVRFLYEYGAFVDSESNENETIRSRFHCHVIDERMDDIEGTFFANAPALENIKCSSDPYNSDKRIYIETLNSKVGNQKFYDCLERIYKELNYVIVALGDDELSITTAVRIYNYIRMRRDDESMKHLRILVHCKSDLQEQHLTKILDHYNQVFSVNAKDQDNPKHPLSPIEIFGTIDQIFTYNQIVENKFEERGHVYNEEYCRVSGNNGTKDKWNTRRKHFVSQGGLDDFCKLRRQELQDVSNAYHAITKIDIMEQAINNRCDMVRLNEALMHKREAPVFSRNLTGHNQPLSDTDKIDANNTINVQGGYSPSEKKLLDNLARLEHLRWNAAHEILGYQGYSACKKDLLITEQHHQCNEQFKFHNCLIPWEELDKESIAAGGNGYYPDYKLFDYCVLTTSIILHQPKPTN